MDLTHVTATLKWTDGRLQIQDEFAFRLGVKRALRPSEGEVFVLRVERPEAAYTQAQLNEYWGYIVAPIVRKTGHSRKEIHAIFKAALLPDDVTSLTQLNHETMDEFIQHAHVFAREECPEAFERPRYAESA